MHFSVPIVALLAGQAIANPTMSPVVRAPSSDTKLVADAIAFAVQQPAASCNVISCVEVVAAIGCIVAGIGTGDVPAVVGCVGGGAEKLCDCAGCIKPLGDFLTNNHVCS